jgi:3-deoxy-manno-octulosonate cytidylyltransferase (CMP-KDO synthetase)
VGGVAIVTDPDLPSGSDRVWAAVKESAKCYDIIINLQGDVPTLEPRLLHEILLPLADPAADIATLAAVITDLAEHHNPSVVKIVLGVSNPPNYRALYFSRACVPANDGTRYHHIGVYAYRRTALEKFVALPPSPLEIREKLEQLRALEAGMRIDARVVDTVPLGVDTPEDLIKAQKLMQSLATVG